VQAIRLTASFELLTRSVALTGSEKSLRKTTCVSVLFLWKSPEATGSQSVESLKGGYKPWNIENHNPKL